MRLDHIKLFSVAISLCVALSGCSAGANLLGLNTKADVPQAINVPVGNSLALPPDLQLAAPTQTSDAYRPNGYVEPISQASANTGPQTPQNIYEYKEPTEVTSDVFAKYGVSRFRPNGKLKTLAEMKVELRNRVFAKKRQANANYGTIGNLGRVISGQDEIIMKP